MSADVVDPAVQPGQFGGALTVAPRALRAARPCPRNVPQLAQRGVERSRVRHLFDHDTRELTEKIAIYRRARAAAGHAAEAGRVTVMLHTLVGEDAEETLAAVRAPFTAYLKTNLGLLAHFAQSRGRSVDAAAMAPQEIDELAGFVAYR